MYKKITHNIVEEHYGHPMAVELKAALSDGERASIVWPRPPSTYAFRQALIGQFNQFNAALRNYTISVLANGPDVAFNETKLPTVVSDFIPFIEPYYGQAVAEEIAGHLNKFVVAYSSALADIKANRDSAGSQAIALSHLKDLATTFIKLNPQFWAIPVSADIYLTTYGQALFDQAIARQKQDWAADFTNAEKAFEIIANGPVYYSPFNSGQDFSQLLSNAIIQQSPTKFS